MSLHTQCLQRIRWCRPTYKHIRICSHGLSTARKSEEDEFLQLRAEMLSRPIHVRRDYVNTDTHHKLQETLKGFLPPNYGRQRITRGASIVSLGHHLVWFNPLVPEDQLLPDGTDPQQSPGGPWVRCMWAGGEVKAGNLVYYDHRDGFIIDRHMICGEHIEDVQLKGHGDAAKIFVTIGRRYASLDRLERVLTGRRWSDKPLNANALLRKQILDGEDWGDAILKEQHTLVFLKEKTSVEQEAIAAGELEPVKYLNKPPGEPDFTHTLTPTRTLLFRFSALTFNAHLIHLDREYARNVEGHRNLLVHGPLSLTLMLQVARGYINKSLGGNYVLVSIQYRNLAPLYCDEEMRICIMKGKESDLQISYTIWIEGPTGGVAVKGTVLAIQRLQFADPIKPAADSRPQREPAPVDIRKIVSDGPTMDPTSGGKPMDVENTTGQTQVDGGVRVGSSADAFDAVDNRTRTIVRKDPVRPAPPVVRKIVKPVIRKIAPLEDRGPLDDFHRYGL